MTPVQKSNLLAGSVIGILLTIAIVRAFSWYSLLFLPWAVWEIYAAVRAEPAALITHAMIRLLKHPLVAGVLAVGAWHYLIHDTSDLRAFLGGGVLVHFIFQNQIVYETIWSGAARSSKYGRVRVESKRLLRDEPVWLFRATDKLLPGMLLEYATRLLQHGQHDYAAMVHQRASEILRWQNANAGAVKLPG